MKTTSILMALLSLISVAHAQSLEAGEFRVPWEDGWTLNSIADPIRYIGPGPTGVTIDCTDHGELDSQQAQASRERFLVYAVRELPKIAARNGEVVVPLTREDLPSGYTVFSIGSARTYAGRDYFGLIFLSVSPQGRSAQFAVEGFGTAKDRYSVFHDHFVKGTWKTEPEVPKNAIGEKTQSASAAPDSRAHEN